MVIEQVDRRRLPRRPPCARPIQQHGGRALPYRLRGGRKLGRHSGAGCVPVEEDDELPAVAPLQQLEVLSGVLMYFGPGSCPRDRPPNPTTRPSRSVIGKMSRSRNLSYTPFHLSRTSPARSRSAFDSPFLPATARCRSCHPSTAAPSLNSRAVASLTPRARRARTRAQAQ